MAVIEGRHDVFQRRRRQLTVADDELHLGHLGAQEVGDVRQVAETRHDIIGLTAAVLFAQQGFAQGHWIVRQDIGAHGDTVDRRRRNDRHVTNARQRHLQGARDRRRRQGEHMDVGAEGLELLLVLDAKVLLFVDDDQAEILEADLFGQQGMRADDDLDLALLQAFARLVRVLLADQARQLTDTDRPALEALAEGLEMLTRQQRRRADNGDLLA